MARTQSESAKVQRKFCSLISTIEPQAKCLKIQWLRNRLTFHRRRRREPAAPRLGP